MEFDEIEFAVCLVPYEVTLKLSNSSSSSKAEGRQVKKCFLKSFTQNISEQTLHFSFIFHSFLCETSDMVDKLLCIGFM